MSFLYHGIRLSKARRRPCLAVTRNYKAKSTTLSVVSTNNTPNWTVPSASISTLRAIKIAQLLSVFGRLLSFVVSILREELHHGECTFLGGFWRRSWLGSCHLTRRTRPAARHVFCTLRCA